MRILHLCLSCFYIDGYNYQENILPRISHELGHDVKIIASTETFVNNNTLGYIEPKRYMTEYGVEIIRLPYKNYVLPLLTHKLRFYRGLYEEIENFSPEIIFSHDVGYGSLLSVVEYVKKHDRTILLADTHAAFYNSGQNWISKKVLHEMFYRRIIKKAFPYIKKYYYIGPAEKDFSVEAYSIDESKMEYMPLGGTIPNNEERQKNREEYRNQIRLKENELLFVHTGKLHEDKKTIPLLQAFIECTNLRARLVIIGSIGNSIKREFERLICLDDRIAYEGWQNTEYLYKCLCACDLYCQPGARSATLQNAICCGASIMARKFEIYTLLDKGNFIWVDSKDDIRNAFFRIASGEIDLRILQDKSMECAHEYLNYYEMEKRIRNQYYQNV